MAKINLYWQDLTTEAQGKILTACGSNLNLDVIPLFSIDTDAADDELDYHVCPECGEETLFEDDDLDGEENGYGELHCYWTCPNCLAEGKAVFDLSDGNRFVGHE